MSALKILKLAKEKVEQGWIKNRLAVSKTGELVAATDPNAVRWCVGGALCAARNIAHPWHYNGYADNLFHNPAKEVRLLGFKTWSELVKFNNAVGTKKKDVISRFNAAIEKANPQ